VEHEPIDDFERDLHQAFERRPAPPSLKRRLMERRSRKRPHLLQTHSMVWLRLAACLVLAAMIGGGLAWRRVDEMRKGEAARRQVFTALRITNHALNQVNAQLAAHSRSEQE
jgi:hypothetical protein